jgi:hypothetical protein
LAIEVVKLLVKLLMKLYQTGPYFLPIPSPFEVGVELNMDNG